MHTKLNLCLGKKLIAPSWASSYFMWALYNLSKHIKNSPANTLIKFFRMYRETNICPFLGHQFSFSDSSIPEYLFPFDGSLKQYNTRKTEVPCKWIAGGKYVLESFVVSLKYVVKESHQEGRPLHCRQKELTAIINSFTNFRNGAHIY